MKLQSKLKYIETALRTVAESNVNGGHTPFEDMMLFEHIEPKQGVIYFSTKIQGTDGNYKIIVLGTKVNE